MTQLAILSAVVHSPNYIPFGKDVNRVMQLKYCVFDFAVNLFIQYRPIGLLQRQWQLYSNVLFEGANVGQTQVRE